jgi:hypothetical protein
LAESIRRISTARTSARYVIIDELARTTLLTFGAGGLAAAGACCSHYLPRHDLSSYLAPWQRDGRAVRRRDWPYDRYERIC